MEYVEDINGIKEEKKQENSTDDSKNVLDLLNKIEQLQNEIQMMKNEKEIQQKKLLEYEEENKKMKKEIEDNKNEDQIKKIVTIEEENKKMRNEIEIQNNEIENQQKRIDECTQEKWQMIEENDTLRREISIQSEKIDKCEEEKRNMMIEIELIKDVNENKQREINQCREEYQEMIDKIYSQKAESDRHIQKIKEEFNQSKEELKQAKEKLVERKGTLSIIVVGSDNYNQLGGMPNNSGMFINPPVMHPIDPSTILSFSIFVSHSVIVTKDGKLLGISNNETGNINGDFLQKTKYNYFAEFSFNDINGNKLTPLCAACFGRGTVYMLKKNDGNGKQLILCSENKNTIYLEIGNEEPVALFTGFDYSAAITINGGIIIINPNDPKNSPNNTLTPFYLPDGEKASQLACCKSFVVALSENGRVFKSDYNINIYELNFTEVAELVGSKVVSLSGVFEHCIAVTDDSRVFGYGSNYRGRLAMPFNTNNVSSFTLIQCLQNQNIYEAYAGTYHTLFRLKNGKILAVGDNQGGQLLPKAKLDDIMVCMPIESSISFNSSFCIANGHLSIVFIGGTPPNMPNRRIQIH